MSKKELEKKVRDFSRNIKKGDIIELLYDGEVIAQYEFIELSIDSKSPIDWLRGVIAFDIEYRGRDIKKTDLAFKPFNG